MGILPQSQFVHVSQHGPVLEIWRNANAGCLLFYPGSMLAPGHYSVMISALYNAGFTVAGVHLSGHGECPASGAFVFNDLLAQGLRAENWLLHNGFNQVAVCGHSQGGILTLAHAGVSHTLMGAFALCAVFPRLDSAISITRFAGLASRREQIMAALKRAAAIFPGLPVPLPAYLCLRRITAGKKKPLYMGRAKGRLTYPLRYLVSLFDADISRKPNCPFMLVCARNDGIFSQELCREVFDLIISDQKYLLWLEEGGHMAPLNPALANYVSGHIAAAAAGAGMRLNLGACARCPVAA